MKKSFLLFLLTAGSLSAQETIAEPKPASKVEYGLEGMIGLSAGHRTVGINVGGPSLKVRIGSLKAGFGAFPSLVIVDDRAYPRLAVSPIVEYKSFLLITPYYGYDNKDRQIWTFGFGYRFK
jgi:hypothetical protein